MTYTITKQAYKSAVRWSIEAIVADRRCVIGHYQTRKAALTVARLLAGRTGTVSVAEGRS